MVSQIVQVERLIGIRPDQSLDHRPSHSVVQALPDHAEGQRIQLSLVSLRTELSQDLLEPLEPRANPLADEHIRGRSRMEHFPEHRAVSPILRLVDGHDMRQKVINKTTKLLLRRLLRGQNLFIGGAGTTMSIQDRLN